MRRLIAIVTAACLLTGCHWMRYHPKTVVIVPAVAGAYALGANAESIPMGTGPAVAFGALGGAFVGMFALLAAIRIDREPYMYYDPPDPDAPICPNAECTDYSYQGPSAVELTGGGGTTSADRPEAPVLFDQTHLEPTLVAGTDERWMTSSASSHGVGDRPIHNCAEAKRLAYDYLRASCPSIQTRTSHLRAYRIYAAPCSCSYSAGATYCHADAEGVCAIDGSNTAAFAYATATDRSMAETLSWKNAERSVHCPRSVGPAVMGCAFEDNEWVCFGRTECQP